MAGSIIRIERQGQVHIITIDRPAVRNALSVRANMMLAEVFDAFEQDPDARVAILTGSGPLAFCVGGDLKDNERDLSPPAAGFGGLTQRFNRLKPVIAAVNGLAFGGGFELALSCDIILASKNARFSFPEPRRGMAAMAGGLQRLPRAIGDKRAMGIILTAREVNAIEGQKLGFVHAVYEQGQLLKCTLNLAHEIADLSPIGIRASMEAVQHGLDSSTLQEGVSGQRNWPATAQLLSSEDRKEGIRAFRQKRKPVWRNA